LSSFFSFGVRVGGFLTFFFASSLLLMPDMVVDGAVGCSDIGAGPHDPAETP
jgi:hypothetical protein